MATKGTIKGNQPPICISIHRTVASSCPLRKAVTHRDGCFGTFLFLLLFCIETACSTIRTAGVHSQPAVDTLERGPHKTNHHPAGTWGPKGRAQSADITVSDDSMPATIQIANIGIITKGQATAATKTNDHNSTSSIQSGLYFRTSFSLP